VIDDIKKAQRLKEEFNKDMESLKTKNQTEILEIKSSFTQIKNILEDHSSSLQ
jgi:hypothetical protein